MQQGLSEEIVWESQTKKKAIITTGCWLVSLEHLRATQRPEAPSLEPHRPWKHAGRTLGAGDGLQPGAAVGQRRHCWIVPAFWFCASKCSV